MDRTNVFAAMAAITASLVVIFEYLRYSETRLKIHNVPVAAAADQLHATETHTDQPVERSGISDADLSAQRPTMVSGSKDDQLRLRTRLIMKHYELHCSCDEHAKNLYFNWPYSCAIQRKEDDIVVQAVSRPTLVSEFGDGPYEALALAYRTIEYFTRKEKDMDPQQLDAYNRFKLCSERKRVLDILSLADVRGEETDVLTQWLFE
jgi:hypothetical protein